MKKQLIEQLAERIILQLDEMARAFDPFEYGLPRYPEKLKEMRDAVVRELAADRIAELVEGKWVSTKDRFPDNPQYVLAYEPLFKRTWYLSYKEGAWFFYNKEVYAADITYWMELPQPPTQKGTEQ